MRGEKLTCQKTSIEIFGTVVVVARFDPSFYPQIVIFYFIFFILFYLSRFTTYQKESRKSFAYPQYTSFTLPIPQYSSFRNRSISHDHCAGQNPTFLTGCATLYSIFLKRNQKCSKHRHENTPQMLSSKVVDKKLNKKK